MRSFCLVLLSVLAQSQNPLLLPPSRAPKYLTIATSTSAAAARAGTTVSIFADVTPNRGIHVYAPGAKDYRPIAMDLDPSSAVVAGKTRYPKSDVLLFEGERVPVFQKPFRLARELTLARTAKTGSVVAVTGTVNYQACDDKICYVPVSVPVSWTVTVR